MTKSKSKSNKTNLTTPQSEEEIRIAKNRQASLKKQKSKAIQREANTIRLDANGRTVTEQQTGKNILYRSYIWDHAKPDSSKPWKLVGNRGIEIDTTPIPGVPEDVLVKENLRILMEQVTACQKSYDPSDDPCLLVQDVSDLNRLECQNLLMRGGAIVIEGGADAVTCKDWDQAIQGADFWGRAAKGEEVEVEPFSLNGGGERRRRPMSEILELCDKERVVGEPQSFNHMQFCCVLRVRFEESLKLETIRHDQHATKDLEYMRPVLLHNLTTSKLAAQEHTPAVRRTTGGWLNLTTTGGWENFRREPGGQGRMVWVVNGVGMWFMRGIGEKRGVYLRVLKGGMGMVMAPNISRAVYTPTPTLSLNRHYFSYHLLPLTMRARWQDAETGGKEANMLFPAVAKDIAVMACAWAKEGVRRAIQPPIEEGGVLFQQITKSLYDMIKFPGLFWPQLRQGCPLTSPSELKESELVVKGLDLIEDKCEHAGGDVGDVRAEVGMLEEIEREAAVGLERLMEGLGLLEKRIGEGETGKHSGWTGLIDGIELYDGDTPAVDRR